MKIGAVDPEVKFGLQGINDMPFSTYRLESLTFINSGVIGLKFTKFSYDVQYIRESSWLLTRFLALRYSNWLWNANAKNKMISVKSILCFQN